MGYSKKHNLVRRCLLRRLTVEWSGLLLPFLTPLHKGLGNAWKTSRISSVNAASRQVVVLHLSCAMSIPKHGQEVRL